MLRNGGARPLEYVVTLDPRYPVQGARTRRVAVAPGTTASDRWPLATSDHWYDVSVTLAGDATFLRRFAGKIETGRPGRTDPGIGAMQLTA